MSFLYTLDDEDYAAPYSENKAGSKVRKYEFYLGQVWSMIVRVEITHRMTTSSIYSDCPVKASKQRFPGRP